MTKKKPSQKKLETITLTPENKCSFCQGSKCCTYITQPMDTPRSMADFDYLAWQVSHANIQAYKDEDGWFLLINHPCLHLQTDGGCGIYDKRPMICREHSNDYCEYDSPAEEGFDIFLDSYETLDAYCRKRFKKWDKRFKKWLKA
jgi:Fe-S-cluster containining protein